MGKIIGLAIILAIASVLSLTKLVIQKEIAVEKPIEIILTGDVMLGRTVMTTSLDNNDPVYPFRKVADVLRTADLVFVNLENPVIEDCPPHTGGFTFCTDPRMLEGLKYAGVDVVNLANNHTYNYGKEGFEQTKKYLTKGGIEYVGDSNIAVKQLNKTKFAFVGFDKSQQNNPELTPEEEQIVYKANSESDVLIVAMHWGVEYENTARQGQRKLAEQLVNLGADVVAGHHPHWVQDIEYINGKPVYYSLGNFIFDQMWSRETRSGMAVKLTFQGDKFISGEHLSLFMDNWAQPAWVK